MQVKVLERKIFKEKFLKCYDKYLSLSTNQSIAVGIYIKDQYYVFGNGIEQNHMYEIGSITKTITAHLILKLAHLKLIDLDLTIDNYLYLKKGNYPTINELLTHSFGYGYLTPIKFTIPSILKYGYSKKNIYEKVFDKAVIKVLEKRRKMVSKSKFKYSDFNYAVLALVIEKVCKKPYASLLEDFIKQDLKLSSTQIFMNELRCPQAFKNNKIIDFWKWRKDNPFLLSGGVVSNVYDMLKYITCQIQSQEEYITMAHQVMENIETKNCMKICRGWNTYKKSNQLWSIGGTGTFRASIIFNKHLKIGVVVLGNNEGVVKANVAYLAKMIYGDLKMRRIKI